MTMTELSAPVAAPEALAGSSAPALWVWRSRCRVGDWLPAALFEQLALAEMLNEPFAEGGAHHALVKGWRTDMPREADEKKVSAGLDGTRVLLHTVDGRPDNLHAAMVDAAAIRPGRHLLLYLQDPAIRLADRLAGAATRPSTTLMIQRDRDGISRMARVWQMLRTAGLPVHGLALDVLASEGPKADAAWQGLWRFLGADAPADPAVLAGWRHRLRQEAEAGVASLDARTAELIGREAKWLAGLDLWPGFLKPVLQASAGPDLPMRLVRFDRLPAVLTEGEAVRLAGVIVPAGELAPDRRLFVRQAGQRQRAGWNQPSPAVVGKLPGEPAAANARFKPLAVRALRRQPVSMLYRSGETAPPVPVAQIQFEPIAHEPIEGIYLAPWSIGYQAIPKVACTSIKELLFRLAMGAPYSPALAGSDHVHNYFYARQRDVGLAQFRFVVVRDPIKRFLSAFSNRVLHHKELSRAYLEKQRIEPALDLTDFPFEPNLAEFVERFDFYRRVPTINHHFQPFSEFLAPLSAFNEVYAFERLDDLVAQLQRRTGQPCSLPHSQRGGPKIAASDLSHKVFDKLAEIYAADYAMLRGLYAPSDLR